MPLDTAFDARAFRSLLLVFYIERTLFTFLLRRTTFFKVSREERQAIPAKLQDVIPMDETTIAGRRSFKASPADYYATQ
jgi:hypothetical protein